MNAAAEFEPNTQPRRDVFRVTVQGCLVTATVTYGPDGKPTHVLYRPDDNVPENMQAYARQFTDLVNMQLEQGWDYDKIEAYVREYGVFWIVEPLIDVLRVST